MCLGAFQWDAFRRVPKRGPYLQNKYTVPKLQGRLLGFNFKIWQCSVYYIYIYISPFPSSQVQTQTTDHQALISIPAADAGCFNQLFMWELAGSCWASPPCKIWIFSICIGLSKIGPGDMVRFRSRNRKSRLGSLPSDAPALNSWRTKLDQKSYLGFKSYLRLQILHDTMACCVLIIAKLWCDATWGIFQGNYSIELTWDWIVSTTLDWLREGCVWKWCLPNCNFMPLKTIH